MKSLFEELGGTYHQEGDYFLPDLSLPETAPVGIWGQRRRHYLKTQRRPLYNALLLGGKLNDHLIAVDTQAEAMFFQLVKQSTEQMKWVRQMNSVRNRAEKIIRSNLIYV